MVSITQLEYIVAVNKEQNFHRAAESCHVTQPTLSKMIKNLEGELGVILFDRSKSPVRASQMGEVIIQQAKVALKEIYRLQEIVDAEKGEIKGVLRVGIIPTIAPYLLPLVLSNFHKKYPLVDLSISELTTPNCLAALDNEDIDLAILATEENSDIYFQDFLFEEKMYLYINQNHPLAKKKDVHFEDLKADEMWLLEEGHCLRSEIVKYCQLKKVENKRPLGMDINVGNLESLRYLVQENFGYTLLPELSTLKMHTKEKRMLKDLKNPVPVRPIYFTSHRKHLKQASIEALKQEVIGSTKKYLSKI